MLRLQLAFTLFLLSLVLHAQLKYTVVEGDTSLHDKTLEKIDFSQYIFSGYFNCAFCKVRQADFSLTYFNGIADFGSANFQDNAAFDNATFDTLSNFLRVKFQSRANFSGTVFNEELILEGCTF